MATDDISTEKPTVPATSPRRRRYTVAGLLLRLLFALAIAWLIITIFFATSAISH